MSQIEIESSVSLPTMFKVYESSIAQEILKTRSSLLISAAVGSAGLANASGYASQTVTDPLSILVAMNYLSFTHLGKVTVHQLLLYQFFILSLTDSVSLSSWGCCGQSSSWHSSTFFAVTRTPHPVHPSTGVPSSTSSNCFPNTG